MVATTNACSQLPFDTTTALLIEIPATLPPPLYVIQQLRHCAASNFTFRITTVPYLPHHDDSGHPIYTCVSPSEPYSPLDKPINVTFKS
jgi:hypothetical protein